jgi:hypothetical protein
MLRETILRVLRGWSARFSACIYLSIYLSSSASFVRARGGHALRQACEQRAAALGWRVPGLPTVLRPNSVAVLLTPPLGIPYLPATTSGRDLGTPTLKNVVRYVE